MEGGEEEIEEGGQQGPGILEVITSLVPLALNIGEKIFNLISDRSEKQDNIEHRNKDSPFDAGFLNDNGIDKVIISMWQIVSFDRISRSFAKDATSTDCNLCMCDLNIFCDIEIVWIFGNVTAFFNAVGPCLRSVQNGNILPMPFFKHIIGNRIHSYKCEYGTSGKYTTDGQ